jgi:protein ImuB
LAGNPDTAILAARFFEGVTFVAPGEELLCLGELPIEAIGPIEPIIPILKSWGIRTFREFAMLPAAGVSERLGQMGVDLQRLACGKTERHLILRQPAPVFQHSIELEYSIKALEPLSFILARLLNQLCANLEAYALATNELRVQFKLEDGSLYERQLALPTPMRDHKVFLKLLLLDTEMHPPTAAVNAISIAGEPVKPRVVQTGLFIPLAPEPEKLELTLARLAKLVGAPNLGSPELLNTHRPDAFRLKRFDLNRRRGDARTRRHGHMRTPSPRVPPSPRPPISPSSRLPVSPSPALAGFRMFRPALRAMVDASPGYPTQINAWGKNGSVHGKVVRVSGPWRTTGDWWSADGWARDEWDVAVASQSQPEVLYRIYREIKGGAWFVEGLYD